MTDSILTVDGVTVSYGAVVALRDVSLKVEEGATCAILGANGAGKTSLLRAITGLEPVRSGTIHVRGEEVTGDKPHEIARRGVAHVPDNRGIFPSLSVGDNLRMGLYGAGRDGTADGRAALANVYELFPILEERTDQAAGNLSGGQQQMLTIGRALLQDPALLLLDEMSMGLAPSIVDDLFDVVRRLQERGITVVLVEQFVGQAMGVAHQVAVLEQGRIVAQGTPAELAGDELAAAYLGAGDDDIEVDEVPPPPAHVQETMRTRLGPAEVRRLERLAAERGVSVEQMLAEAARTLLTTEDEA